LTKVDVGAAMGGLSTHNDPMARVANDLLTPVLCILSSIVRTVMAVRTVSRSVPVKSTSLRTANPILFIRRIASNVGRASINVQRGRSSFVTIDPFGGVKSHSLGLTSGMG